MLLPLERPLNSEERYLFAISERLDLIIELLSKFIDINIKPEQKKQSRKK